MSKIVEGIKEFIVNRLEERKGNEYYLCDIGMALSESENMDGSWYCSAYEAKQEVIENWNFCGEFYNYYKDSFGNIEGLKNPFEDVEIFHCQMMIFAVENSFNYALNKTDFSDMWDEKIEITEEFIKEIKEALKNLTELDIF